MKKLHYFKVLAHYLRKLSQTIFALFQGSTIQGSTNQGITVHIFQCPVVYSSKGWVVKEDTIVSKFQYIINLQYFFFQIFVKI